MLISALDISIVGPLLPVIRDEFGVPGERLHLLVSLFLLANVFGGLLGPALTGRWRPSDVLMGGMALFGTGAAVMAAGQSYEVLLAGRILQGVGAGAIFPIGATLVYFLFPAERRGRVLGLLGSVFGISFLIGPVVAGAALDYSWRWLFVGLAVLVVPLFAFYVPRRALLPPPLNKAVDRKGIVGLATVALLLGFLLVWRSYFHGAHPLGTAAAGAALGVALIGWGRQQLRSPAPLVAVQPLRSSPIREVMVIAFLAGFVEAAPVFVPAFLVDAFGVSAAKASFMLMPMVAAMALAAPLSGWMTDRFGPDRALIFGGAVMAAAFIGIRYLPLTLVNFYIVGVFIGVGLAFLLAAPLRYLLLHHAPLALKDVLQGNMTLYLLLGQMAGTVFLGMRIEKHRPESYLSAFYWLVLPSAAIVLLAVLIGQFTTRNE